MIPIKLPGSIPAMERLRFPIKSLLLTFVIGIMCANTAKAQMQWAQLGQRNLAAGDIAYPSLTVDNNGRPYLCYSDYQVNGYKATVMSHSTLHGWTPVGQAAFSADAAYFTSIAIDNANTPYVAFQDKAKDFFATVMKYNGSAWVTVGASGFSDSIVDQTMMAVDNNGTPYVAFRDGSDGAKVTVMKYNGTDWVAVGKKTFTASNARKIDFALDNNNVPYIAYTDESSGYKGYVMKYDGADWVVVGNTNVSPSGNVTNIELAFDNTNTVHVTYCYNCCAMTTKKFDGTNWIDVCSGSLIGGGPYGFSSFALDKNNTPHYAVTTAGSGYNASVYKYDGTNFVQVGGSMYATDPEVAIMAIHNNDIYVAYQIDYTLYMSNISVMRYGCKYPQLIINPCGVYTDTLTGKNVVIWQSSPTPGIDSYRVYREDNGSYKLLATLPGGSGMYVDQSSTPATQTYKYKLTHTDICDREMPFDSTVANIPVKLRFNYLTGGEASISWSSYQGAANYGYTVRRSNNGGTFEFLAMINVTGSDTTYVDNNPPQGSNRYRVDTRISSCNNGITTTRDLTSNIVTAWNTRVEDIEKDNFLSLTPNPTASVLYINSAEAIDKIEVFNLTGQKMVTEINIGENKTVMDVSSLPRGVYLLRVNEVHNRRFVKQ